MADIEYFPSPRSNPKGPQQVPLFNMKPRNRWRLGYSPERKRAMEKALPPVVLSDSNIGGQGWAGDFGQISQTVRQRGGDNAKAREVQAVRATNRIARALSQSKVRPEELSNIQEFRIFNEHGGSAAEWNWAVDAIDMQNVTGHDALLHEIGHSVDPANPLSEQQSHVRGLGYTFPRAEGFAEGFAQSRYVPSNVNPVQFSRGYDKYMASHPLYRKGVQEGSGGTVSIEEEERRKPRPSPQYEQLRLEI